MQKGYYFRCNHIRTVIHDENIIAKRNCGCVSNWEKFYLKSVSLAEKYGFLKQEPT